MLKGLGDSNLCEFLSFRQVKVPISLLEQHYQHVSTKDFYPWLLRYMSSGPSYVILLEGTVDALSTIRELLGHWRAHKAHSGTLRFRYSPYGGANCLHLSDGEETARFETSLWKQHLAIEPGQFDVPIQDYINRYLDKPNNTLKLRELCLEVASAGRPISHSHTTELQKLLAEECFDATPSQIEFMVWVFSEGCFLD